ncbi:Fructosamine kinase-domain-containing protein [Xylariomycetidae sp. FL0641]|nr:Fructosamine kinase-domain-containing protein [Xylariomycetidae sp. FL0641]
MNAQPLETVDVARHGGEAAPTKAIPPPLLGSDFELDPAVVEALPVPGTVVLSAHHYGRSLWGRTAMIEARLPGGERERYFLKTVAHRDTGPLMIRGEFESLKAIHEVAPELAPAPHGWGEFSASCSPSGGEVYFLLAEFREIGQQPPEPVTFTARLAALHKESRSPTGKFGFHVTTCHATLPQATGCWEASWEVLYRKQLAQMVALDREKHGDGGHEFAALCQLTLDRVIPRLLGPLQSEGRSIKPCLLHGDLWDENTATDTSTGEPFVFDCGSLYGHNEYEIGNWRSARHRLSGKEYVENYKRNFEPSEPKEEWDDRNLLYSLRYDLGASILIDGCNLRQVVSDRMLVLCEKFCPSELHAALDDVKRSSLAGKEDVRERKL